MFSGLTVEENLRLGAFARANKTADSVRQDIESVFEYFPRLKERRRQLAGTLSGGEQQMLAIARCLMGEPELVMFDEPSLGLSPAMAHAVLDTIVDLNKQGLSCLLVEQNVAASLEILPNTGLEFVADPLTQGLANIDMFAGDLHLHGVINAPERLGCQARPWRPVAPLIG